MLHRLRDHGNTVVVIEHNLDVIKTADWIIDLGPEGGARGGQIIAAGTPEQVAKMPQSHTGHFLKPLLERDTAEGNRPGPGALACLRHARRKTPGNKKPGARPGFF